MLDPDTSPSETLSECVRRAEGARQAAVSAPIDVGDANAAFARAFVDELVRGGVTEAVVAPGSRSTPLALAFAADVRMTVHVLLDERSAAGFALGAARASGRPSVLCCTSGTAAAHFHWAVLEAHHGRVPLIVCTADRPPELQGVGAGQTIDQTRLYGDAVRWFHDPGPPDDCAVAEADATWREVAARSVLAATGSPAGPVHLNLPFREPLVPSGAPLLDTPGRPDRAPWLTAPSVAPAPDAATVTALVDAVRAAPRGVLVAGWGAGVPADVAARFAAAAGWPVLADPISGLREGPSAVSTYDALLRVPEFAEAHRPDLVVRVGAPLTSKVAGQWLSQAGATWLVDRDGVWLDPDRVATERVHTDPAVLLDAVASALDGPPSSAAWLSEWTSAERLARSAIDEACDAADDPFESRIARDVVASLPAGSTLLVASSMPVRDVESFAAPRTGVTFLANRGVNGIDGFVSTVLGAAAGGDGGPVVGLLGDLCFLHDTNGLLGARDRGLDATFVVVDNDGGGIFSFLPQGKPEVVDTDRFEELFGTPHGLDLAALAAVHGVPCAVVERAGEVGPAVQDAVAAGGVQMVLVRTDRAQNVARHQAIWDAVRTALVP
jgi:2-succinyl-5-enolpyruvyl-6-hydroxy-3-cyclohexene-1-carboxylate synthase